MKRHLISSPTCTSKVEGAPIDISTPVKTPLLKKFRAHSPLWYEKLNKNRFFSDNLRLSDKFRKTMQTAAGVKDEANLLIGTMEMSPLTQLANSLGGACIGTPTSSKASDPLVNASIPNYDSTIPLTDGIDEKKDQESSLMSNAFTINSAKQSPTAQNAEQKARSVQRRMNIAPLCMNYDAVEKCVTPEKSPEEEFSFYPGNSPQQSPVGACPISPCDDDTILTPETSPPRYLIIEPSDLHRKRVLQDDDPNSMDSGYHAIDQPKPIFQFATPTGTAPRKTPAKKSPKTTSISMFHSLSTGSSGSADEDYMELFDMESVDDDTTMPPDLNSLLSGDIKAIRNTPDHKSKPIARRSLSMNETNLLCKTKSNLFELTTTSTTPPSTIERTRHALTPIYRRYETNGLNTTPYSSKTASFKRPEPPTMFSPVQSKRYKYENEHQENIEPLPQIQAPNHQSLANQVRPLFKKSVSMNDAIMNALAKSNSEPNLIGDFSKPFVLPLMDGRHSDLKSISCETMARLIRGDFKESVASYKIIDCRYPYEYEGGHIQSAVNLFMQEQIIKEFMNENKTDDNNDENNETPKRHILVFHCEFSSERGPKLSRFLRSNDRLQNENAYPALHYPEIYLLHGGYKDFYAIYPELCEPNAYRPMLDPEYTEDYKHFRAKTRSWSGDTVKGTAVKGTLKKSRSRLVL